MTNSEYMKQELRLLFDTKCPFHVSYPKMDLPRGEPAVHPINTIGFVNKGARKGQDLILSLARTMPEKRFLVFGVPIELGGRELCNLESVGYVSDRDVMFRSADLFLVPSVWDEPYGRVAAEAIWSGRPVIVSKNGGLPEAAPHEPFWEPSRDPGMWERKIHCLADPAHRSAIRGAIEVAQNRIAANQDCLAEELMKMLPA